MICVTGSEKTMTELRGRLLQNAGAALQEARIDLLAEPFAPPVDPGVDPQRMVVTCRPEREGGGFTGSEDDRLELLERALAAWCPGWVDLELDTAAEWRKRIVGAARRTGTKVLYSQHVLEPGSAAEAECLLGRLDDLDGDAIKLAVAVDDAADLAPLRAAASRSSRPTVVLGMGAPGLLSRALYSRFHSVWTYVAAEADRRTAPGQLSVGTFEEWNLPAGGSTALFALLGGAQVLDSPGPRVYNRLFARREIDACYLPVITDRPAETLALLLELGLRGASVTMPLKERVAGLLDDLGSEAAALGVVNTVTVVEGGVLRGDLTDGLGALAALERACGDVRGRQAVVLGAGATAAAVARALGLAGAQVTVLGRDRARVEGLATRLAVRSGAIEDLEGLPFEVLVNATPVGADDPDRSLVGDPSLLKGKIVLDVAHGGPTRLLREAAAQGGRPVSGRTMWAEQGRRQLARWLGVEIPARELEEDR